MFALREQGVTAVVLRDPATRRFVLATLDDKRPPRFTELDISSQTEDLELVASSGQLGILVPREEDAGGGRALRRVMGDDQLGAPTPFGSVACSGAGGVYSLQRERDGWQGVFVPLADTSSAGVRESKGPRVIGRGETTLVCGATRAFVVTRSDSELRALEWAEGDTAGGPLRSAKWPDSSDGDHELMMAAAQDQLVVAKLTGVGIETLVWTFGASLPSWQKTHLETEGLALEAIEAAPGVVGLLMVRSIESTKGCKSADATDAILEVAMVDTVSGKLAHPVERIETWRCGAEPGPFYSGWARGNWVIGWPRGTDSACAHSGVRYGGLGFAEIDPTKARARARVGRAGTPADALVEAGCDGEHCFAAALTRGSDPCGPADSATAGRLEVVSYPPMGAEPRAP